jgi:hypothetical protein
LKREAALGLCLVRERRREKEATVEGFKYPWTYAGRKMSEPAGHCLGGPNFVQFRLYVQEKEQR